MATTINYTVRRPARKDGTFAVNISVIHNRERRRMPTSVYVTKGQLSRDLSTVKDLKVEEKLQGMVMELRGRLLEISHPELYTVDQIVAMITRPKAEQFRLDLFDFAADRLDGMEPKTAECYNTALNAVERFVGRRQLDVNDITATWVRQFRDFLENEPALHGKCGNTYAKKSRGTRAISSYLGSLRHLHNLAKMVYNDEDTGTVLIPRSPFKNGVVPRQPLTEHRVLTIPQIKTLMQAQIAPGTRAEMARDVFMLSFALAGTNTIDLFGLRKAQLDGDLLTYNRAKTDSTRQDKAKITLLVPRLAADIIAKYAGEGDMLLNFASRYRNAHDFNRAVNLGLKTAAEVVGFDERLSSYYARHSWATIARNVCRVDFDTVNAALNHVHHGTDRIGDIYIARDYSAIWRAQKAVIKEVESKSEKTVEKLAKIG